MHCKDIDINPLENSSVAVGYIKAGGVYYIYLEKSFEGGFHLVRG